MDETMIKAILDGVENDNTILKALVRIIDDLEEVKAGLAKLTGKPQ